MTQEDFAALAAKATRSLARLPEEKREQSQKVLRELKAKVTAMMGREIGRKKK